MNQVVEILGLGTATASGTLIRKQVLPRNKSYRWPGQKGKTLEITDSMLDEVVSNFEKGFIPSVPFTKVNERNGHSEDPENVRGTIVGLEKTPEGLDALIRPRDEEARKQILSTQLGVSAGLNMNYETHDTGEKKGAVLRHVAWTPEPWISGMKPFEEVSLSGETFEVVFLSAAEDVDIVADKGGDTHMAEFTKEEIQAMVDATVTPLQTQIADLTAANTEAKETIVALTGKVEARVASITEESVDAELSTLVQAGLAPAISKAAKPLLMAGSDLVNLSADETTTVGAQVRALLSAIPKVEYREIGEGKMEGFVLLSDEQVEELGIKPEAKTEETDLTAEQVEDAAAIAAVLSTVPEDRKVSK